MPLQTNNIRFTFDKVIKFDASFSRNDSTTKVLADVHEGINSTLLILQHRLKASGKRLAIQVIKQYGDLPQIKCYPGLLNQVLMNLLANAIEALEERMENEEFVPQIHIHTQLNNAPTPCITIQITDNGIGMSEEVKQRLFEPLFTTKPAHKGTGLGLSIARQIIEDKHSGRRALRVTAWKRYRIYYQLANLIDNYLPMSETASINIQSKLLFTYILDS